MRMLPRRHFAAAKHKGRDRKRCSAGAVGHFRAVPKQQTVRRPPQDGRPASALTDKQSAMQSDKAFRHWPIGICIWPNVEESGDQRRRWAARSVKSRPPLGLRFTAGLGRLLTGKVYSRKLAART